MSQQLFEIDDIVEIHSTKRHLLPINGKKGVIKGISEAEEDIKKYAYAVTIPFYKKTIFIFEEDLLATGKKANPQEFESDYNMRVDKEGNPIDD